MEPSRITTPELKRRLDTHEPTAILDTRAAQTWDKSEVQLPGALRVPPDEVSGHLSDIPRDRMVVTYCT